MAALTPYKNWTEEAMVLASQARADGRKRNVRMILNL